MNQQAMSHPAMKGCSRGLRIAGFLSDRGHLDSRSGHRLVRNAWFSSTPPSKSCLLSCVRTHVRRPSHHRSPSQANRGGRLAASLLGRTILVTQGRGTSFSGRRRTLVAALAQERHDPKRGHVSMHARLCGRSIAWDDRWPPESTTRLRIMSQNFTLGCTRRCGR
eukprot:COSAG05_NODE_168_length_15164_cov_8.323734_7_plen_165_part_00